MAEGVDFSEILRSPLAEPDRGGPWWPLLAGIAVGALAVIGGYGVARSGGDLASPATTTIIQESTSAAADVAEVPFPPGYEPLSESLAAKPDYAMRLGDELFIAVGTVFRRGFEVESGFLEGGEWVLETGAGEMISSDRVITNPDVPGVVSIVFPDPGDAGIARLRLVERWEPDERHGSATLPVESDVLGVRDKPVSVDLGGGVSLAITRLELTERGGSADWVLEGTVLGGDVTVVVRVARDGQDLAIYFPAGGAFFGPRVVSPGTEGTTPLSRDQAGSGTLDGATSIGIEVNAALLTAFPADVTFDIGDLPVATQ